MRFAVIDMEGSTLDAFDDASSAIAFLSRLLEEDSAAGDDLGVIEYRDGQRLGPAILAADFVARSMDAQMQAVMADALHNVRIDSVMLVSPDGGTSSGPIDIALSPERIGSWEAVMCLHGHLYPLVA